MKETKLSQFFSLNKTTTLTDVVLDRFSYFSDIRIIPQPHMWYMNIKQFNIMTDPRRKFWFFKSKFTNISFAPFILLLFYSVLAMAWRLKSFNSTASSMFQWYKVKLNCTCSIYMSFMIYSWGEDRSVHVRMHWVCIYMYFKMKSGCNYIIVNRLT